MKVTGKVLTEKQKQKVYVGIPDEPGVYELVEGWSDSLFVVTQSYEGLPPAKLYVGLDAEPSFIEAVDEGLWVNYKFKKSDKPLTLYLEN